MRRERQGGPRRRGTCVHERGYSAATVQVIADELGILKGSLYHYIDTKEDSLYRLLDEVHTEVGADPH
jgi:AcrR family transcriptional regulator